MNSMDNQKRPESKSWPFTRFIEPQGSSLGKSMASTSGNYEDPLLSSDEFVRDERALLSLHPWIFRKDRFRGEMGIGVDASRVSLRSRRRHKFSITPVNLTNNYFEVGKHALSSPPNSPARSLSPFVVTDGSRIISKSSFDSFGLQPESGLYSEDLLHKEVIGAGVGAKRAVIGVPLLPESKKLRRKGTAVQHRKAEACNSQEPCGVSSSQGLHDDMLPFCIGISIGVISALLLKRTEVDKLNNLLKQTEDLVQDLQEELEMKDALSVKEIDHVTHERQKIEESTELWKNQNLILASASRSEHESSHLNEGGENSEQLSLIEAELEAELERLEQNMNASDLDQRMSELAELDPDLVVDVVHGELRADNIAREIQESQADTSNDTNSSMSGPYNANYSVSPKELSLRLHQVIQSRLEERIEELENELLRSQMRVQAMGADRGSSQRSTPPEAVYPFCLDLSGDALDAYNEAQQEFMKVTGDKEDNMEVLDGYKSTSSCRTMPWDNILWSRESNGTTVYGEEEEDSGSCSDEEEKRLIQHLIERTRKSPTSAQKMFLLMEE